MTPTLPAARDDVVEPVMPDLRRRSLFREEDDGPTLRRNSSIPLKRHATGRVPKRGAPS